jgi:hypothetical protein
MGHLPAGNGAIGRVSHQSRVVNNMETQTTARSLEGMGLSKVGGCFDGVQDEVHSGVRSDPPADNCGVCCDSTNPPGMQTGQATEGGGSTLMVVGTAYGFGCS